MVKTMAPNPIILALANPEPEIRPELAKAVRPDCIIATGRSDYPNQVNNVLCFPYIFPRRARLRRLQDHGKHEARLRARNRSAGQAGRIGRSGCGLPGQGAEVSAPTTLIPTPFDTRLIMRIAPAVAQAAAESGVAMRPSKTLPLTATASAALSTRPA